MRRRFRDLREWFWGAFTRFSWIYRSASTRKRFRFGASYEGGNQEAQFFTKLMRGFLQEARWRSSTSGRDIRWLDNSRSQGSQWRVWISKRSQICCRGTGFGHSVETNLSVISQALRNQGETPQYCHVGNTTHHCRLGFLSKVMLSCESGAPSLSSQLTCKVKAGFIRRLRFCGRPWRRQINFEWDIMFFSEVGCLFPWDRCARSKHQCLTVLQIRKVFFLGCCFANGWNLCSRSIGMYW